MKCLPGFMFTLLIAEEDDWWVTTHSLQWLLSVIRHGCLAWLCCTEFCCWQCSCYIQPCLPLLLPPLPRWIQKLCCRLHTNVPIQNSFVCNLDAVGLSCVSNSHFRRSWSAAATSNLSICRMPDLPRLDLCIITVSTAGGAQSGELDECVRDDQIVGLVI